MLGLAQILFLDGWSRVLYQTLDMRGVEEQPAEEAQWWPIVFFVVYTVVGYFLWLASFDPTKFKVFISFAQWGAFFCHGCVATVSVLTAQTPNYVGPILGGARRSRPVHARLPPPAPLG